jgi:hypothetical protein
MRTPDLVAIAAMRVQLWDAGYRPIAVYSHDHPDRARAGKAPLGTAWTERARRNPPEAAILPAVAHATNTGLLCDGLRAIDVDVDNAELAGHVRALFIATFGDDVPIRYRENSGRCAALLRAAAGSPGKRVLAGRLGKIEVLGHGQQFIAHGTHPSGAALYWYPEAPEQVARDTLRAVTEDEITAFFEAVAPLVEAEPEHRPNGDPPGEGQATAEIYNIVAALNVIPNDKPADWEHWNAVGMATWVASGGSEAGCTAWRTWSAKHPAHDEAACRARWQHYPTSPPTRTGAGKLFAMAAEAVPGWRPWPQPVDFFSDTDTAPPVLQPEHLPDALWGFAFDTAGRMGVDPVAVALGSLVSCAAVITDEWRIQPKRYDSTWTEQARLWAAIAGPPSILKTPVIAACTKPIDALDSEARARHKEEMREYRAAQATEEEKGDPRFPKLARYLVEGCTIEALSEVLRDDDDAKQYAPAKKVLVRQDELAEFLANLDRYRAGGRGGGDRGAYLRLYNGGRHTIDRIGRGSFAIPNWSACFLGGIQPEPIRRVAKSTDDDGLLARFVICVPAQQEPGVDRAPNFAAIRRYEALFPVLAALRPSTVAALHADAHRHREDINALANAMALMPDTPTRLQAALGKWPGLFARLCLVFHLIGVADARCNGWQVPYLDVVPEATGRRVANFMRDILAPHLMRAEALMFSTTQTGHARWIAGHILAHRLARITSRDVVRSYGALRPPEAKDELAAVMASLVTVGWLEPQMPSNPARPISAWTVNPGVHNTFEARAKREGAAREKIRETIAMHADALRGKNREEELT